MLLTTRDVKRGNGTLYASPPFLKMTFLYLFGYQNVRFLCDRLEVYTPLLHTDLQKGRQEHLKQRLAALVRAI